MYAIEVKPAGKGRFEARLDGRRLCVSRQPFLDSARVLWAEGYDPRSKLVMRHAGSANNALASTIGAAAELTVHEPQSGNRPKFALWRPFEWATDDSPPMAA